MAILEVPVGNFPNVTGVVDATAAGEITALFTEMLSFIPDPSDKTGKPGRTPDYGMIPPSTADKLRKELNAMKAAIAAAPTV